MARGPSSMVRVAGARGAVADALRARRPQLLVVALLSAMLNMLALTGSIYLMMVYDRVIPGHSLPSLFSLFAMVLAAYLFIALFDSLRALILLDLGHLLHRDLAPRVFDAEQRLARARGDRSEAGLMRDLDQVRGFLGSPGPAALIDLPWIALFLIVLTLVHVWLAVVTMIGALLLVALTIVANRVTGAALGRLRPLTMARAQFAQMLQRHADLIPALGMQRDLKARWSRMEGAFLAEQVELAQRTARLRSISSTSRMFVQSCVLTCGAYLVVTDRVLSGGIIFASSILSGRALAPLDAAIGHWRSFTGSRQSWRRLDQALAAMPVSSVATALPPPAEALAVENLTLAPPGARQVVVSDVSFRVQAGQIVGVIGPSASGKSSLLRGLIGLMTIARGAVRLDGATIDQWADGALGAHVGYLPQSVELLDGSVAENIARFDPTGGSDEVIAAARAAGVHDMIVRLAQGYETRVGEDGGLLSAGQRQRIGLARALFRDPFLVLLDEPNSNLDPDGEAALAASLREIRVRGGIALVAAHRVAVLQTVDLLLVMNAGRVQAFGPRDEILARLQPPPAVARDGTVVPMRS